MEIEHNKKNLTIHLDTFIRETLAEYMATVTKFLKLKQVPMHPWIMLELVDCPESPDPGRQKVYRSFVAKLQFTASWVRCDIALLHLSWQGSVLPQVRCTVQYCTM